MADLTPFDLEIRRRLYDGALNHCAIPTKKQLSVSCGESENAVEQALERLAEAHMIVLQPDSREVLMANPFSAVPTPFLVRSGNRTWYGNCIWDAMGIAAMIHADATLDSSCGCCGYAVKLEMPSQLRDEDGRVAHFAIPAKRWWDDIVFN